MYSSLNNIVLDVKKVRKALRNIKKEIKNPKKFLNIVGKRESLKVEKRIQQSKISPDNKFWQPWSYSTLQQRMREGNVMNGLLYRTGNLLRSFFYKVRNQSVEIPTDIKYAEYLQFGTSKMPAREFLGFGKDSIETLPLLLKKMIIKHWK